MPVRAKTELKKMRTWIVVGIGRRVTSLEVARRRARRAEDTDTEQKVSSSPCPCPFLIRPAPNTGPLRIPPCAPSLLANSLTSSFVVPPAGPCRKAPRRRTGGTWDTSLECVKLGFRVVCQDTERGLVTVSSAIKIGEGPLCGCVSLGNQRRPLPSILLLQACFISLPAERSPPLRLENPCMLATMHWGKEKIKDG